jgi:poly(3-hydroxybutyrate) depolymerase
LSADGSRRMVTLHLPGHPSRVLGELPMRTTCRPSAPIPALLIALAALGVSAHGQSPTPAGEVPVRAPGVHNERFARANGPEVRYAISVPPDYSTARPAPLVLALHFGGNPFGAGAGMLRVLIGPAFADLGAIIVAPDSIAGAWSSPDNERAVIELLDAVQKSYRTDPERVVVTGFSMGGAGVWHFAGKYPERFSAAIPVAGRPSGDAPANWQLPVFAVHSRDDEVVPIGPTEARIKELRQRRIRAELVVVSGMAHHETARFADPLRRAVPWLRALWK